MQSRHHGEDLLRRMAMRNEQGRGVTMNFGRNISGRNGLKCSAWLLIFVVVAVMALPGHVFAAACKSCEVMCKVIDPTNPASEKYLEDPPCQTVDYEGSVDEGCGFPVPPNKCAFLPYVLAEYLGWEGVLSDEDCSVLHDPDQGYDREVLFAGGKYELDGDDTEGDYVAAYYRPGSRQPKLEEYYDAEDGTSYKLANTYDGTEWTCLYGRTYSVGEDDLYYYRPTGMGYVDGYTGGSVEIGWEEVDVEEETGTGHDYDNINFYTLTSISEGAGNYGYVATINQSQDPLAASAEPQLGAVELRHPRVHHKVTHSYNSTQSVLGGEGTKQSWAFYEDKNWLSGSAIWELKDTKYFYRDENDQIIYTMDMPAVLRMMKDLDCLPDGLPSQTAEDIFAAYANEEFEYSDGDVIRKISLVACCGGAGTVSYLYGTSSHTGNNRNYWVKKRAENHRLNGGTGNGTVVQKWVNSYDQVVHQRVTLYVGGSSVQKSDTHYEYRANGDIEAEYTPSVIDEDNTDPDNNDGSVTPDLETSEGTIYLKEYYVIASGEGHGLSGKYTDDGELAFRVDGDVNINPSTNHPDGITGTGACGVVWAGKLKPEYDGVYTFHLQHASLKINGETIPVTDVDGTDVSDPCMYAPSTARFMQRDPMQYVDGMSLYTVARLNPLAFSDPSGLFSKDLPEVWEARIEERFEKYYRLPMVLGPFGLHSHWAEGSGRPVRLSQEMIDEIKLTDGYWKLHEDLAESALRHAADRPEEPAKLASVLGHQSHCEAKDILSSYSAFALAYGVGSFPLEAEGICAVWTTETMLGKSGTHPGTICKGYYQVASCDILLLMEDKFTYNTYQDSLNLRGMSKRQAMGKQVADRILSVLDLWFWNIRDLELHKPLEFMMYAYWREQPVYRRFKCCGE